MKKILFVFLFTLIPHILFAQTLSEQAKTAEDLVKKIWQNIGELDMAALDNMMSESFQAVHKDGSYDKTKELEWIKALTPEDYKISDMRITEAGADTLIVTYQLAEIVYVGNKETTPVSETRMSIFQNADGDWKWIAQATLEPAA